MDEDKSSMKYWWGPLMDMFYKATEVSFKSISLPRKRIRDCHKTIKTRQEIHQIKIDEAESREKIKILKGFWMGKVAST